MMGKLSTKIYSFVVSANQYNQYGAHQRSTIYKAEKKEINDQLDVACRQVCWQISTNCI